MLRITTIITILFIVLFTAPTLAQNSNEKYCTVNNEDKSELSKCLTNSDNECYIGGVLEGKCNDQWMWDAGWYLARYNRGQISLDVFPVQYYGVLPPITKPSSISTVCKIGFNNRYCANIDKTGTRDAGNDGSIEEVEVFLPPTASSCPSGYVSLSSITGWHGGLFTDADLAPLGINNTWQYCHKTL